MKISVFVLLTGISLGLFAQDPLYFSYDPSPSPDGNLIYFGFDDDLWVVPSPGGKASRLTAMDGRERFPSVSPDGKWIAFSSNQYGNNDVYVMSVDGGEIRQLTFHESNDEVESWSWDSESIYFTSNRENRFSTYTVSATGGTPVRTFGHYFNNVHNAAEHPDGRIFFNESWESKNFTHRKRYKGAYNPDIKSYDTRNDEYKEWTEWEGKDMWATIDRKGSIYYVSDEYNGEYNLYSLEGEQGSRLTDFETSVMRPRISANGDLVVFSKDYRIHTYHTENREINTVEIALGTNNVLEQAREFNVENNISAFDISPDKKKIAFISRGELFISDIKGKYIRQLRTVGTERVREVKWLANSSDLIYSKSRKGYFNWYTRKADGSGAERELSSDTANNRLMDMNSDRTRAIYLSGRDRLMMMDLSNFSIKTLVEDEFWAMYNTVPTFSPNDEYVLYTAYRDFEQDIFVYHFPTTKITNLTNTAVSETSPVWSPDGKYIYFEANLTEPNYPTGGGDSDLFRVELSRNDGPYKSAKLDEVFKDEAEEEETDDTKKRSKKDKDEAKEEEEPVMVIDPERFMERAERVGPSFGYQAGAFIIQDSGKTIVYYLSNHDEGTFKLWKTTFEDFINPKTEKAGDDRLNGYELVTVDDTHYMLKGGNIHTFNASSGSTEKIETRASFSRGLQEEFRQMFDEAWAGFGENYYDGDFHGQDWTELHERYSKYLPFISNRGDLRQLFNDMLGELNTSHFGFYSFGDEEDIYYGVRSQATGILFEGEDPYLVERIVRFSPADHKQDIRQGDRLVAVNGIRISPERNRESYFLSTSLEEELELTLSRDGNEHKVKVHPADGGVVRNLMYNEWIESNQRYIDEKGDKRIAYIHMKNMGGGELQVFLREMASEVHQREALILDLRYNTGGNVHDEVLRSLSRQKYMNWKYRDGQLTGQSNFSMSGKPIVMLINEQSLSDAEVTSNGFKELGLGTLIGTETYRWIIFTSGMGLVDGSFYRLPSWGCYSLDGTDLELSGVKPDIVVNKNFHDRLKGDHPQLDRAVEEILKQLN